MQRTTPRSAQAATDASRRRFLKTAAGSTLMLGLPATHLQARAAGQPDPGELEILRQRGAADRLVLEITADNLAVFHAPLLDMGQGIHTALAMLVSDELDAHPDLTRVQIAAAGGSQGYRTAYSLSMRLMWQPVRRLAAEARARLVTAAAQRWNLDANTLVTRDSTVIAPDGRQASYGELSAAAAQVGEPAVSTAPRDPSGYRQVGQGTNRANARAIVTGAQQYTQDLDVPGAVHAVIARPERIGAGIAGWNDARARALPGVIDIVAITPGGDGVTGGIAVLARTSHEAIMARDALEIEWTPGPLAGRSDADLRAQLVAALPPLLPATPGSESLDASYSYPYLAHAPMETLGAIANVQGESAEIWYASQFPDQATQAVARATGLDTENIRLHIPPCGGAFGRRLHHEAAVEAALVSQATGRPVRLHWTREDDLCAGRYRPMSEHRLRASWISGQVIALEHAVAAAWSDLGTPMTAGIDPSAMASYSGVRSVYRFGLDQQKMVERVLDVPTGSWRATYSGFITVSQEMFIDRLADAMGQDPLQFRLQHLAAERVRACLGKVAEMGNWGAALPAGHAQGLGVLNEFGSAAACLVQVDATNGNEPRITRAFFAVDVGVPLNPRGIEAQLQGCLMDAWAAMFRVGNHLRDGAMAERNFDSFAWPRFDEAPREMSVFVFPASAGGEPGGSGELGFPPAAAACANAYARATGRTIESMPILGGA